MSMYSLHLIGWVVRPQLAHAVVSQNCIPGGDEELFFLQMRSVFCKILVNVSILTSFKHQSIQTPIHNK